MDDERLIALFDGRRTDAIEEASAQYGTYCKSIALNILRSEEDSEECFNDTMLKAWNSIPPEHPSSLKAYLGRITRNLALDRLRRKKSLKRGSSEPLQVLDELADLVPSELDIETELEAAELREKLNSFIEGLGAEKRILFVRRYWYMLSIEELAERHGMSKSKVKMQLLRIRAALREYLKKEGYL